MMKRRTLKDQLAPWALGIALFALSGGLLTAQQQQQPQQQPPPQVTQDQIDEFADVVDDVVAIRMRYEKQMSAVDTPAQAQALQQKANQEMIAAIEAKDMTAQEYNTVSRAISADPKAAEYFKSLQEKKKQP